MRQLCCAAVLVAVLGSLPGNVSAQGAGHERVSSIGAVRTSARIDIDGTLSEEAWASAVPFTGFRQRDPDEGRPVTEETHLRILYDDRALYVGAALLDRDAPSIVSRLSRRDDAQDSDYFAIYLDP